MEIIKLLCKFSIALSLCVSLQDQSILNWRPQKSFINHSAKKHTQISSIASYFIQHYACMHCASYATQRGSVVFNCMMNITSNYWGIKNNLLFLIVVMKSISWAAGEEIESRRLCSLLLKLYLWIIVQTLTFASVNADTPRSIYDNPW